MAAATHPAGDIMTRRPAYHDAALARDLALEHSDEQYQAEIEKRAKLSMEPDGEYDPFDGNNLSEALGDFETCDEITAELGRLLHAGDDAAVGAYLRSVSVKYWTKNARLQAKVALDAEEVEE